MHLHVWPRQVAALACAAVFLLAGCDATDRQAVDTAATAGPARPDSAGAAAAALDTLARLGMTDFVVDSLVRRGDTAVVWAGPRRWMATDRPTSAVSVTPPARVAAVRHVYGG